MGILPILKHYTLLALKFPVAAQTGEFFRNPLALISPENEFSPFIFPVNVNWNLVLFG
jgi:hypothetical protein